MKRRIKISQGQAHQFSLLLWYFSFPGLCAAFSVGTLGGVVSVVQGGHGVAAVQGKWGRRDQWGGDLSLSFPLCLGSTEQIKMYPLRLPQSLVSVLECFRTLIDVSMEVQWKSFLGTK